MNRNCVILAAGKGTRMNLDEPKVLLPVGKKPMIDHVVGVIESIDIRPVVVVGYKADRVKKCLDDRADYSLQENQLGTGHAVACASVLLSSKKGNTLVLYGDHPLVTADTCLKLFEFQEGNDAIVTMATTKVSDFLDEREIFSHYGRVIRSDTGDIEAIREAKDCSTDEFQITEVNPGYYCFNNEWLWGQIDQLQINNEQNEYYLTDLIENAFAQKQKINFIQINNEECLGANTPEQLNYIESIL
ncbi:hypothetical protein COT97_04750 [Candidatus Falkowbacteria bacterium CG10_big_fil_rev_8_21_14_0_10_39_11]|uniref:MobA-like NTP transferase domain-containing protein n=1 Tax=Candidatus Falkowbacteria bacterium CG10_big_fil_rev_8_21_14_0_10_39_11 TaxID=1974565 RepID=A0A2H0V427_9BACT|nr:MAG: hypothetical protein COT97_04750 [Candidatus Falkowbacteria bacterium CG10_big_fil_rev_8_21_14_0_10_39_11]